MTGAAQLTRARRRARQTAKGVVLLAVVVTIALCIAGLRWWVGRQRPTLNTATLCPERGPRGLTVVLIDRTESLSALQAEALRHQLERVKDNLPPLHAIEVYSLVPMSGSLLKASGARVCSPPRPESGLTANPTRAQQLWDTRFSQPLQAVFEALLQPHDEPSSPILESIQSVSVTAFDAVGKDIPRRLIVASDMLQNTAEFSQYQDRRTFVDLRSTAYYSRVRSSLPGVQVQILYVRRHQHATVQGATHVAFWEEYFSDCGATLDSVISLPG